MRPGPPRGATATLEVVVSPEMTTPVGDGVTEQAVYGTVALVEHIERVCRMLLDEHLEAGEGAVGARVEVLHRAPVPVGETIRLIASVATVTSKSLVCEVLVRLDGTIVARGSFEHAIVPMDSFVDDVASRRSVTSTG